MTLDLGELWRYRELLFFLALRDVKLRYKQTALGAAWAILQPLLLMLVFTVFFSRMAGVASDGVPYPLFAYAGLLPWVFFSNAVTAACQSVVGSERLITKVYFPRMLIPLSAIVAGIADLVVGAALLFGLMAAYGRFPGPGCIAAASVLLAMVVLAAGIGSLLAALNVAYRDVRYVLPFMMQLWMFATPSVYMPAHGGSGRGTLVNTLLRVNPMTEMVAAFRALMLGQPMDPKDLVLPVCMAVLACILGCLYFRKVEDGFADII
jgi:lipopolysaccharide transport system permease protein